MVVLPSSPVWYQSRGVDTSHNGILAFGSRNLVYLLDLRAPKPEIYGILSGHTDKVTSCSFSPEIGQGQLLRLASGADDCSVKVWDVGQKLMLLEHTGHGSNKIISVHWSPVNPSLIISGDEKGFVICWDLDKSSTVRFYPDGSSQMNICSLTCSPHHDNIVAIGYKSGAVSLMDIRRNGTVIKKLRGHTNEVHGIVWVPFKDETHFFPENQEDDAAGSSDSSPSTLEGVIITGSKDKTIKIWSISKAKCIRTLRIPNRVTKGRKVNEDVARLYATVYWHHKSKTNFISSGYNGDVIVWDLDRNASNLFEILASQAHDAGHQRIIFNICRGASAANTIITTSMDRQILHWTIPDQAPSSIPGPDWTLPTLGGFVYSVAVSPKDPSLVAIGVGDGMIRVWKTRSPKSPYDIATLWQGIKEKVMALVWHPTKEGCLAFGTEDGKVGIYDTLSLRPPNIAETYHLKPVYALSWGPKCTKVSEDGTAVSSKLLNLYSCGGDGVIYQHDPEKMSDDAVNIDLIIETSNPCKNCYLRKHSEISWSQDGRFVAIGNDNGCVCLYTSPHLCVILELKCHTKIINCVKWKPPSNENDHRLEIATGSNNSTIFIHDLSKIFSENGFHFGDKLDDAIVVSKPSKSLIGHLSRITGLSYNTRNPSEIVSSSYDSTAQVWNIESEKPLFNFRGHHGRLMCVAWTSVIDESSGDKTSGTIYTGADDYTVHGWYAEDQQHTEPVKKLPDFGFGPKNKFQAKKKGRQKKGAQPLQPPLQNGEAPITQTVLNSGTTGVAGRLSPDLDALLEKKKLELLASMNGNLSNGSDDRPQSIPKPKQNSVALETLIMSSNEARGTNELDSLSSQRPINFHDSKMAHNEEDLSGRRRKRLKNMFPQSIAMDNRRKAIQHQDCLRIVQWKMAEHSDCSEKRDAISFIPGDPEHINLGFYTDRRAAFRMMKNEANKLQGDDVTEGNYNIRLWMGDIVGTIKDATEKSQLTDQLVSMAPVAGQGFWRQTARSFARQLLSEGHHLHAVHYLLICDETYEAIQVLLDGRHYREAVALARARLCDDDPVLIQTIKLWGKKLKSGGSVELAAKCFASIGEFKEAATSLAQRTTSGASNITDSDISSLWAAASIALAAGENDSSSAFANRALDTVCLRTWDWLENSGVLSSLPNLLPYRFISMVHEMLATRLVHKAGLTGLTSMRNSELCNLMPGMEGCYFPELLLNSWKMQGKAEDTLPFLDEASCLLIHNEVVQHERNDVTESRILLLLAFSLADVLSAFTSAGDFKNAVIDPASSAADEQNPWIYRLHNSAVILSKVPSLGPDISRELLLILSEVALWLLDRNIDCDRISKEFSEKRTSALLRTDGQGRKTSTEVICDGFKLLLKNTPRSDEPLSLFYQGCLQLESERSFVANG